MRRGLLAVLLGLAAHVGFAPDAAAQTPTANTDGSYDVPYTWPLKPAGLDENDRFRLLFVTSGLSVPSSQSISFYNGVVQVYAGRGHTAIRPYGGQFRVVGSTPSTDARDNTSTTGTGVPIHWLNGAKVADDYSDFWDGSWDNSSGRTESGKGSARTTVWTGSRANGTGYPTQQLGSDPARVGSLASTSNPISDRSESSRSGIFPYYGLSPVFVVGAAPAVTIAGGPAITEGGTASFTIRANIARTTDLTVNLSVADAGDFVDDDDEGNQTVTIAAGETEATVTVATVNDTGATADEPKGEVTVTLQDGTGYTVGSASSASVTVNDDDATTVTLEGKIATLPEGSGATFTVRLNRALVAGEALPVPLTFAGTALVGTDYTVSCPQGTALPAGVACTGLNSASATITFTGPSAASVDLTLATSSEGDVESAETVIIGLGTLNTSSGTGLGGGATGADRLADFNIVESFDVQLSFTTEASSVREGATGAEARFSAYVRGGTVPEGGALIPFTVNSGTPVAGDASPADYGTVPAGITIAAGATSGTADVPIVDDELDELRERMRFVINQLPPGYRFFGGSFDTGSSRVTILDDDATVVSLTGGGTITEGDTTTSATMTIRLSRSLSRGPFNTQPETVNVPLALTTSTGAALPGSANPLFTVTASGTGVTITNANTATPTITFTGHATNTVQEATVTFTATTNGDTDSDKETVTATMSALSSTNLDGGVQAGSRNSAVLTIADKDAPPELSVAFVGSDVRRASLTEGGTATIRVTRAGGDKSTALSFSATATDAAGFTGTFNNVTSFPVNQRSVNITYSVAEDSADAPAGEATYVLGAGTAYTVSSTGGSVSLEVIDNDPTTVTLAGAAGNVEEGEEKTLTVTLGRGLVSGETLTVPLPFGGTATRGTDYTLACASATGVACANLDSGNATVTFTGPTSGATATSVGLTLTAVADDTAEPTPETVDIGLGMLTSTGLDGGASGTDTLARFSIEDPPDNAVNLSISDDGEATEGGGALTITATLDSANASGGAISIPIQVRTDGTTAQATDYTVASSISIANNALSGTTLFTVTDDSIAEGDETVIIELGPTLPSDVVPGKTSFVVTIEDNDTAGLVFSPTSLDVDEGDDATYTVKLATEPTDTVTVTITGHASTDLTLDETSLEFSTSTWNDVQTVTVTAGEDDDTTNDTATLTHAASGGGYGDVEDDVEVTVTDNDTPGLVFSTDALGVAEGDDASYTVKLATEPTNTVTVAITGQSGTDLTLDETSLEFSTSTWNDAQTVTVTAGEDDDTTNDTATLTHAASGGGYGDVEDDVEVTVTDNDTPGLVLSPTSLDVDEGDDASYTVKLATQPTNTVTVAITGQSGTDLTLDETSLTFSTSTWNDAQTVTVTAGEDTDTADDTATLTHAASGGGYSVSEDLAVTVTDDDTPGLVLSPTSLDVDEGDDASYTVKLATQPTNTVTVAITGQSGTDLTLDETSLTFSTSTWNAAQTVTVTAGEDTDTTNDTATLTHTASGGGYSVTATLAVTVTDDDQLPVVSFASSSSSAGEDAGTRNVTVDLSPSPAAAITVSYTVTGTATAGSDFSISGSGTLSVSSGAATATIPVAIIDDTAEESTEQVVLTLTAGSGYTVGSANSHTLTITDDDGTGTPPTPAVSLSASPNPVTEGGSVTVTATLSSSLSGSVTVPLTLTAGTAEPEDYGSLASITISGGQTTGTGTVTTAQDADEDNETFTVALGTLPSDVTAGSPSSVVVTIRDDDGTTEPPEPEPEPEPVNRPPTARVFCDPCSAAPSDEVRLTVTASDPDGDRLTYRWSATAGRFTGPMDRPTARWTAPAEPGPVTITVRVSDGEDSVSATVTVEVVNRPPAFEESVYRFELAENLDGSRPGQSIHLGRAKASDPDGDALTYDVSGGDREHFRIGSRDGMVKYVGPGEDFESEPNRYELTVQAQDPHGAAAEAQVVVTVTNVNERPEAEDDAAETLEDEAVTVDVLANDTDPDGDSLRVESVSAPEHGTTRIAAGGGVLYTPEANYHGADRFTYVVTDPEGETASAAVEVTVLSVNDAPEAVGAMPDQPLDEGGGSVDIELAPYFEDVDGDDLAYRAASSNTDVATVRVVGAVLTVTPVVYGSAMVTVTAADPEGLTATQAFTVGVDDRLVRAVLGHTLAAMARSHLASARMTLGRRVEAGGSDEPQLTVMGRAVPLGKAAARQAAEQMVMGWLSSGAYTGSSAHGLGGSPFGPAGATPGLGGYPAGGFGGPATGGPAMGGPGFGGPMAVGMPPGSTGGLYGFGGFGGGPDALLQGTEFELALGSNEEDGGGGWLRRRLSVWGQGDIQAFHGAPTVFRYDARYDGDMRTGYVGVDARLTERWLAGVAVSRSWGRSHWQVGASRGHLKTKLAALHPYAQWSDGTTSVWTMAGTGWGEGEAENVREATGLLGTSGLGLRLGLVELRRELGAVGGGAEFGLRADAAWAELRTGEGRESVDGLTAPVNQQRVGAEVSRPLRLGALALRPFGEAHLRRDAGGGQNGTGVEVAFGLGLTGGIVRLDVQARTLAVHSAAGYGERGAGLTLTVGGQQREGLSLSVSPTWGDAASGTGALWQEEVYRHYLPEQEQDSFAVDARGDYGMRLPNGGLLTWFGSYSHSPYGRGFLVGGSIGGLAEALLPGR